MSSFGKLCLAIITMAGATLLTQAAAGAAEAPAASAVSEYELSLKDLRQVKKAPAPKKKAREERKSKKSSARAKKPAANEMQPKEVVSPKTTVPPEATLKVDAAPQLSREVVISHEPHSYLVPGKRTLIKAVISSAEDIKSVYCRFRAVEGGAGAAVEMSKESGTQFTYAAILPPITAESRFLRYNIVVVGADGKETLSREFVIDVKPSQVMPGWQLEESGDKIGVEPKKGEKPLQGISDKGLSQ